jgi:hypothetical protein
MTQSAAPATDREASVGRLNYLDSSVPSSLYRNGKMRLRRNADGSDSELEGVVFAERQVTVRNARLLEGDQRRTVEKNGFELCFRPLAHRPSTFSTTKTSFTSTTANVSSWSKRSLAPPGLWRLTTTSGLRTGNGASNAFVAGRKCKARLA